MAGLEYGHFDLGEMGMTAEMTGQVEQVRLRPSHETIVDMIHEATADELNHVVSAFLLTTIIPSNHKAILAELIKRVRSGDLLTSDYGILSASINKQKQEAEKKTKSK